MRAYHWFTATIERRSTNRLFDKNSSLAVPVRASMATVLLARSAESGEKMRTDDYRQ